MRKIVSFFIIILLLWTASFSHERTRSARSGKRYVHIQPSPVFYLNGRHYHHYNSGYQSNFHQNGGYRDYDYHNNGYQTYSYQNVEYLNSGYQSEEHPQSNSTTRQLDAWVYTTKKNINGAFAPQYSLMYKNYRNSYGEAMYLPASVMVRNLCYQGDRNCQWSRVMLKAWIPGFTDTATVTKNINANEEIVLVPNFNFNRHALARISTPVKSTYEFRVYNLESNKKKLFFSQAEPVTIQPIDVNGSEAANVPMRDSWYSVWVTPNMDSVSAIHKQMERELPENLVMAYHKYGKDKDVASSSRRLVKALYNVFAKKGIRYVNNPGISHNGQKIKYPIQVLRHRQANCIEGVTLFASILESLGMHVYIVLIPDHAFLGWQSEDNENSYQEFLETTLTWNGATFEQALESGNDQITEQINLGNFDNGNAKLISINEARELGIMPNDIP